jgi:cytochrome c oxidase assembly protein subunit 15
VIAIGTLVTGSGPHAGDLNAPRLDFVITTIVRFHSVAVWLLLITTVLFYLSANLHFETRRWLRIFFILSLLQGLLGYIQYLLGVPEGLVALHLLGSVLVWISAWRIRLSIIRKHA